MHLNDSKKELGSRVDRHESIGKGLMGLDILPHDHGGPPFRQYALNPRDPGRGALAGGDTASI